MASNVGVDNSSNNSNSDDEEGVVTTCNGVADNNEKENDKRLDLLHSLLDKTSLYSKFIDSTVATDAASSDPNADKADTLGLNKLITGTLRSYQIKGVEWLSSLYENGLNGILADDMGLGKTIQVISFFALLRSRGVVSHCLVVAPLSTLGQWCSEFQKWCPSIPVVHYHGNQDERAALRADFMHHKSCPVIVTSFEIAMRDRSLLSSQKWKLLVVDEAHRLKNFNCRLIRDLKRYNSESRLLLTGTPLQNNLKELWSLLNFLLPAVFDDLSRFESWFDFDDKAMGSKAQHKALLEGEKKESIISKLHAILRPFVLRRVKADVALRLPGKREIIIYTPLTETQTFYYRALLRRDEDMLPANTSMQNVLMQFRKVCNHPYLLHEPTNADGHWETTESLVQSCGKLQLLDEMLHRLKAGNHRVLIFSQMTRMLDILEDFLTLRSYHYGRIDGSTASVDRSAALDAFNAKDSQQFVFLLSTRAGGLGLNLVGADTVILYDSDWNPTQDAQAQDRCHRIGQTRAVLVYRLVTPSVPGMPSVEMQMLRAANNKRKLETLVMSTGRFSRTEAKSGSSEKEEGEEGDEEEGEGDGHGKTKRWKGMKKLSLVELMGILSQTTGNTSHEDAAIQAAPDGPVTLSQVRDVDVRPFKNDEDWAFLMRREEEVFTEEGIEALKKRFPGRVDVVRPGRSFLDSGNTTTNNNENN